MGHQDPEEDQAGGRTQDPDLRYPVKQGRHHVHHGLQGELKTRMEKIE